MIRVRACFSSKSRVFVVAAAIEYAQYLIAFICFPSKFAQQLKVIKGLNLFVGRYALVLIAVIPNKRFETIKIVT